MEKRDLTKNEWTEVATLIKDTSYLVTDLLEGHEYEFRVSAVNENGQGPPLVGDQSIIARLPFDLPSSPGKPTVSFLAKLLSLIFELKALLDTVLIFSISR